VVSRVDAMQAPQYAVTPRRVVSCLVVGLLQAKNRHYEFSDATLLSNATYIFTHDMLSLKVAAAAMS
jgi:hypothetical protein